jgi:hypothetical protein
MPAASGQVGRRLPMEGVASSLDVGQTFGELPYG